MKTIYVLECFGGQWEDAWSSNVMAFSDKHLAEAAIEGLQDVHDAQMKRKSEIELSVHSLWELEGNLEDGEVLSKEDQELMEEYNNLPYEEIHYDITEVEAY